MKIYNLNIFITKKLIIILFSLLLLNSFIVSPYAMLFASPEENSLNEDNICVEKKVAYLTFDDGPSKNTELILDILKDNNVNATFFIISPYIEPHINFIKRAYDEGNAIGNHTADHEFKYVYTCEEAFFKSFNKQQDFIKEVTGSDCTIFRFPGGSHNTIVKNSRGKDFTKNITEKLNKRGVNVYDWNVDSGDAKGNNIPASTLISNVSKNIRDKDGNYKNPVIILMHDCMTKNTTVEALPGIIKLLKEEGYTFDILK
ncbi:polysaccharide deacetylase family protein [Clostridioides difficile]